MIGVRLDTNAKIHKNDLYLSEMDYETLLVTFLTELLFFVENRICYKDFSLKIREQELKGSLEGYTILSLEREIKAVTFNNLEIRKKDGLFSTQIVFDL
jgi:SHS2 domain-containing protein